MVPRTVLTRSGLISVNVVRPVNTVQSRTAVNNAGPMKNVINNAYSTTRRPFNKITAANNSNFTKKVNTVKGTRVNTARPKAVLSAVKENKGNAGNPQQDLKNKGVIDSGCSRHMTGNRSYLTDYEEIDGGFVAFGGNSKGGKITGKGKIRTGKLDFEDVYFVKELKFNLFSVSQMCDKKNSVLFTDTECVVLSPDFKLTDESHVLLKVPRKDKCRKSALSFIRPFGCPITILNTIDHLGKFDEKADEGFFIGYSTNSKAFRVFNSRTRIVEENLHVQFSENTPNIAGSGPNWLFDIDTLTKSMNYNPVVIGNQFNGNAGTKACNDADSKSSPDAGLKPSREEEKKDAEDPRNEDSEVPSTEEPKLYQEKDDNVSSTNNVNTASNTVNTVSPTVNAAGIEVNAVDPKSCIELLNDPNMPELEDIVYSDDDEDVGAEADLNNLDAFMPKLCRMSFLVDLPNGKRAIGTKWVYRNKKEERGIVIKNKARLVAQGYTQEKGINYDEVFAPVAKIEAIRLFLAYFSFKDFVVVGYPENLSPHSQCPQSVEECFSSCWVFLGPGAMLPSSSSPDID
ncbi:putative ribonuclease H-like domain-containing protein [Tanacetum coccineum]